MKKQRVEGLTVGYFSDHANIYLLGTAGTKKLIATIFRPFDPAENVHEKLRTTLTTLAEMLTATPEPEASEN